MLLRLAALVLAAPVLVLAACNAGPDVPLPCSACKAGTVACANLGLDNLPGTADDRDCKCDEDGERVACVPDDGTSQ